MGLSPSETGKLFFGRTLAAGSVMHAMSGSGDITKMGGLRKYLPRTHISFLIYCLAIAGIFPFAGFFSKDEIIDSAKHFEYTTLWIVSVVGAAMTAAILALLPCYCCWVVELPIGIWALVVLSDFHVRQAFRQGTAPATATGNPFRA